MQTPIGGKDPPHGPPRAMRGRGAAADRRRTEPTGESSRPNERGGSNSHWPLASRRKKKTDRRSDVDRMDTIHAATAGRLNEVFRTK